MNQFDQAPVNGEAIEESIAIVCNGNTAPKAIAAGQYLFIKNHSTLATGGYHATDAIASGDTLSSSNVTSDPDVIANAINGNIPAVVNNLTSDSTTDALSAAQGKALNSKMVQYYDASLTSQANINLGANAKGTVNVAKPSSIGSNAKILGFIVTSASNDYIVINRVTLYSTEISVVVQNLSTSSITVTSCTMRLVYINEGEITQ